MTQKEKIEIEVDNFLKDPVFGKLMNRFAALPLARHIAQWQKEQMINKACKWIVALNDEHHIMSYAEHHILNTDELIKGFNNFMETEK